MGDDNIKDTHGTDSKRHGKPGFKNGKKQQSKPAQTQSLNSDAAVPMLHFGVANNFGKRRDKETDDMRIDRTSMYAYLISKLSKESQDEIQGHADWEDIEKTRDPLKL